jgi:hypothetical protein
MKIRMRAKISQFLFRAPFASGTASHSRPPPHLLTISLVAARSNAAKNSKTGASANIDLLKDASVGGKQLKAGSYNVKADGTTLTFERDGKVVAQAPIEWKDEQGKATYSAVVVYDAIVTEVHFSGKSRYAALAGASAAATGQQ